MPNKPWLLSERRVLEQVTLNPDFQISTLFHLDFSPSDCFKYVFIGWLAIWEDGVICSVAEVCHKLIYVVLFSPCSRGIALAFRSQTPSSFTTLMEILVKTRAFSVRQPSQNVSCGSPKTSYVKTCSHSLARSVLNLCFRLKLYIMRSCWNYRSCQKLPASSAALMNRFSTCWLGHPKCAEGGAQVWKAVSLLFVLGFFFFFWLLLYRHWFHLGRQGRGRFGVCHLHLKMYLQSSVICSMPIFTGTLNLCDARGGNVMSAKLLLLPLQPKTFVWILTVARANYF